MEWMEIDGRVITKKNGTKLLPPTAKEMSKKRHLRPGAGQGTEDTHSMDLLAYVIYTLRCIFLSERLREIRAVSQKDGAFMHHLREKFALLSMYLRRRHVFVIK